MLDARPLDSENISAAYGVLRQLRTTLTLSRFEGLSSHADYQFIVFFDGPDVVAVAGYRILETITRGVHCHIHDLVVDEHRRRRGVGREVLDHMAELAKARGADWIFLDGIDAALGFYYAYGFLRHGATLLKYSLAPPAEI